jgi:hypothetical protein
MRGQHRDIVILGSLNPNTLPQVSSPFIRAPGSSRLLLPRTFKHLPQRLALRRIPLGWRGDRQVGIAHDRAAQPRKNQRASFAGETLHSGQHCIEAAVGLESLPGPGFPAGACVPGHRRRGRCSSTSLIAAWLPAAGHETEGNVSYHGGCH